jgi:Flp pilus assembly pilin Flp
MLRAYVRAQIWLSALGEDRGDVAIEYIALAALVGGAVLVGATVLRGAIVNAFDRLVNLVNGIG